MGDSVKKKMLEHEKQTTSSSTVVTQQNTSEQKGAQSSEQIQNVSVKGYCAQGGERDSQVLAQIKNIFMTEFSDLLEEGKSVSFIILGEEEEDMQLIQQTPSSIVIDDQPLILEASGQKVIVIETEEAKSKSGAQKRKQIESTDQQLLSKQIKLSKDNAVHQNEALIQQQSVSHEYTQSEPQPVAHSETVQKIDVCEGLSSKSVALKCPEAKETQSRKEYSPFITILASTTPSSSSLPSPANASTSHQRSKAEGPIPVCQNVSVKTDLPAVKASPSLDPAKSVGGSCELSPIKISSPGANVELASISDSADSSEKEGSTEPNQSVKDPKGAEAKTSTDMVYRCTECDYASSNKHYYKQHVDLVHNSTRPFKCPFCDYAGKRGHALREHLIVHSAHRPYSCQHCNATFRKKGHLTNHTKLHAATSSQSSSDAMVAVPLPKLAGAVDGAVDVSSAVPSSATKLIKIPISGTGNPSTITIKGLPTGTETVAAVATGSVQKSRGSMSAGLKKSQFWCALCCKDMAEATLFQEHLKTVHNTDRLYACESCDYVTAKKEAIMAHLSTHIAPVTVSVSQHTQSGSYTSPFVSKAKAATTVYGCTQCGFTTPLMATLVAHAASHTLGEGTGKEKLSSQPSKGLQQHAQTSKVICSECGHVADSAELMRSHMWTHIKSSETEATDKGSGSETGQQNALSSSSAITSQTTGKVTTAGLTPLPENAAFKCTECSYVSKDASQFVKHMLVHKTQHNQAPKFQAQARRHSDDGGSAPSSAGNANSTAKASTAYRVKPVTTENTCQNTETSPFVHDAATGRFRCTLCGYTCEYQRTIKAHIWKHSGHRHVDYPIFQNGPLSMYEDPYLASQPASTAGQSLNNQTAAGASTVDVVVTMPSQPNRAGSETAPSTKPLTPVTQAASASSAVPLSVKFITVSGSQVLHSSGPLPPGKLKLVPMQAAESSDTKAPKETANKPLVVHVQSTESSAGGKAGGSVVLVKEDDPVTPATSKPQGEDKLAAARSVHQEIDKHTKPLSPKEPIESEKTVPQEKKQQQVRSLNATADENADTLSVCEPEKKRLRSEARNDEENISNAESAMTEATPSLASLNKTPVTKDSSKICCTESKSSKNSAPCSHIASAKHALPACVPSASTFNKNVAVAAKLSQDETVPKVSDVSTQLHPVTRRNSAPASSVARLTADTQDRSLKGQEEQPLCSQPQSGQEVASPMTEASDEMADHDGLSESITAEKGKRGRRRSSTESTHQHGIALRVKTRRQALTAKEPNVVVETVNTFGSHSTLTGLHSQQSSPRIPDSPTPSEHQQAVVLSTGPETSESKADPENAVRPEMEQVSDDEVSKDSESKTPLEVSPCEIESVTELNASTPPVSQDSDSAITLLSLLKRSQNVNPACPTQSCHIDVTETVLNEESADRSPDRSPASSPDTESATKETDSSSKDTTSENDTSSSGKNAGGGGGICSTLLAVIEQLRERSRSESDPEDRSSQPPAKRRAGRRRGRHDSQDDALELGDSDNIEQLDGGDGTSYRCKLCHYTSSRVPLIRLHMRTHRQKDPFECSLCPMKADSSEMLQAHMIQHCKVRTYACKFCPQSFNHKSTLRAHMRAHNDTEPFLCDLCEFESSNPLEYRAHMQKHAGNTLLRCPHCPSLLASRGDLHLHLAAVCPVASIGKGKSAEGQRAFTGFRRESKKLMCPQCPFITTEASKMEDHQTNHAVVAGVEMGLASEGPLQCALCDFTAVSSRSLKSHMKRHANDQRYVQQPLEQYKCSLCGYVCHHLPSLKSHMWRHASDENYSYHFTNDVINAAIDYDTRTDPPPPQPVNIEVVRKEPDEPELLDKVLSAERKIVEGQMSRAGSSNPVCWVRFRCCQCGFETINKAKLNLHMRTHADIINRTLKVLPGPLKEGDTVPMGTEIVDSDGVKIKIVYGPL